MDRQARIDDLDEGFIDGDRRSAGDGDRFGVASRTVQVPVGSTNARGACARRENPEGGGNKDRQPCCAPATLIVDLSRTGPGRLAGTTRRRGTVMSQRAPGAVIRGCVRCSRPVVRRRMCFFVFAEGY